MKLKIQRQIGFECLTSNYRQSSENKIDVISFYMFIKTILDPHPSTPIFFQLALSPFTVPIKHPVSFAFSFSFALKATLVVQCPCLYPLHPMFSKVCFYGDSLSPSLFPHLMYQGTHNIASKKSWIHPLTISMIVPDI